MPHPARHLPLRLTPYPLLNTSIKLTTQTPPPCYFCLEFNPLPNDRSTPIVSWTNRSLITTSKKRALNFLIVKRPTSPSSSFTTHQPTVFHVSMLPAFSLYCVVPNPLRCNTTRVCSRRIALTTILSTSLYVLSSSNAAQLPSFELDEDSVAYILRQNCSPFIQALCPLQPNILMWRGAESHSSPVFQRLSPPSDLLLEQTYGKEGVSFFEYLEQYINEIQPSSLRVLPSKAHIATGSRSVAAQWGTPTTIWPVGSFKYTYWQSSALIYKQGETVSDTFSRGGRLVNGVHLREALQNDKEIMFAASAFFELREDIAKRILPKL